MIGNRRGGRLFGRGGGVRTVPFCLFAVRLRGREEEEDWCTIPTSSRAYFYVSLSFWLRTT